MKKILCIYIVFSMLTLTLSAQNEMDALRYSRTTFGGTARYMALGGAFGALGADASTFSTNPAGIGLYSESEISFTPSVHYSKVNSEYNGTTLHDNKYNFNISNVGAVLSYNSFGEDNSGCFGFNFGFGMNRLANFNYNYQIEGLNTNNSILSVFVDRANGSIPEELNTFDTRLAFDAYLIDTIRGTNSLYLSAVPKGGIVQSKSISTRGAMNEMYFTFGGNYDDKLYIGGTFGIPFIRYTEASSHTETNFTDTLYTASNPVYYLRDFTIDNNLTTSGAGFNFKFGLIYRPVDFVRIGIAVHTPTFLTLSDNYNTVITANFYGSQDSFPPYKPDGRTWSPPIQESPNGTFDYQLVTPFRAIGSVAFIIAKMGLISADYEFVDYSDADLNSTSYTFSQENILIKNSYTAASNIRIGTEWRLSIFALRAGYALYGNPYKAEINNATLSSYSGGIGIRDEDFFIDFTYVYTTGKEDYYLYRSNNFAKDVKPVKNTFLNQNYLITLGLKF